MSFDIILTNDPDHGLTQDYIPIFKELSNIGLKVTTGVFCTIENFDEYPNVPKSLAKHCRKNETHTLNDPAYRDLMLQIKDLGHEIAYHGYSQISNSREKFEEGLEIYKNIFGEYPFTYMEHGGNPKKHDIAMCKKETLDMNGLDVNSEYFIEDLIKTKIKCTWAYHDLLDNQYNLNTADSLFYTKNNNLFFKRHRMSYLPKILHNENFNTLKDKLFIGYTHFGYEGYKGRADETLESWVGSSYLNNAINLLKDIQDKYNPTSYTVKEYVESKL